MGANFDFSGWATKNDLKCSDGRTIRKDAFKEQDGKVVPLVWGHSHDDPSKILGHALLENREEGVYAYGSFNNTKAGMDAKESVNHGDVTAMSIYANKLRQTSDGDVMHGEIKEVSLVLAGANRGAVIDYVTLGHDDEYSATEAVIETGLDLFLNHADQNDDDKKEKKSEEGDKEMAGESDKTVKDVFDAMTEEQQKVVLFMIGEALNEAKGQSAEHSDEEEGEDVMKHNAFEGYENDQEMNENVLSHDEMATIIKDAKQFGSLKESVLQHSAEYGIDHIEYLFPDAKKLNAAPDFIKRNDDWVDALMNKTHHTPFSRIKSIHADITEADARAKGYIKGNLKKEEVFGLLKRTTTPTTIYKKQKLDRDDVIDITDFDVVAWLKTEMRMMLNEEIARAVLVGDGRSADSDDKISELNIRPIWKDHELYTIKAPVVVASTATDDDKAKAFIRKAIKARKEYKGSGKPMLFTTEDMLTDMLLLEDNIGHVLYADEAALARKLRVSEIVTVPVMENLSREDNGTTKYLMGIIVNPADYNIGADKGGAVNMFDDFDIDYNQMKYLIETRCSGALTKPYSAIALELSFQ